VPDQPKYAFRADASLQIGSGHVMRCLTLADALRAEGADCLFVCRDHPGNLGEMILSRGHALRLLDLAEEGAPLDSAPVHAAWLGASWLKDAAETKAVLDGFVPDWLVADHYGIDARWEVAVLPQKARLMVIDDLADRSHAADVLLDQNLGRKAGHYDDLVSTTCQRLIGPDYALLRPEFAAVREQSLLRRASGELERIFVSMGGTDPDNVTGQILSALAKSTFAESLKITVVLGRGAPHFDTVRRYASTTLLDIELYSNANNIASLMADADLAIGAAGGTAWERCCLGLPTLLLVAAGNQRQGARALDAANAGVLIGDARLADWEEKLRNAVDVCSDRLSLSALSRNAGRLCDGLGTGRLVKWLAAAGTLAKDLPSQTKSKSEYSVRQAIKSDSRVVWEWRKGGEAERYYRSPEVTPFADHDVWFSSALLSGARIMLMIEIAGIPVAHVRFDVQEPSSAHIGICIDPSRRGQGIGGEALALALQELHLRHIHIVDALVHPDNTPSIALFKRCGFQYVGNEHCFLKFRFSLVNGIYSGNA
jgi:UDP-2,4-diacetamido-2,4,6-trideoxy-beta-L-altropyranose hydrolase